jgi:hypothetical protein
MNGDPAGFGVAFALLGLSFAGLGGSLWGAGAAAGFSPVEALPPPPPPPPPPKPSTAPWMSPSVDYADPEPPPPPTIETVAAPRPSGPVDSPWERREAQRTEIETVKPPDELVRPAGPPGIICPACRTENEASRRFCQSCGTPLVVTAPVQTVRPRPAQRSLRWLAILIPIVLVAGLIGFAAAAVFKGLSGAGATPGASASIGPTAGTTDSSSGSAGPTASGGPVAARLRLWTTSYSTEVPNDPTNVHSGGKTIDGKPGTSFQQDCAGRQPYVQFTFFGGHVPVVPVGAKPQRGDGHVELATITILPGDQSSQTAWMSVERPRDLEIWIDGKKALTATLDDAFGSQVIAVGRHVNDTIRLVIADTYDKGATSTMCAISELSFAGKTTEP